MPGPDTASRRDALALLASGLAAGLLPGGARAATGVDDGWLGAADSFTLSGGVLVDHTGRRIDGAGVRVEGGVVVALGPQVTGGEDVGGAWICPGFVDAGSHLGLLEVGLEAGTRDDDEGSDAVTPDARVVDAYNPLSTLIAVTRGGGITHSLVLPKAGRLVTGQAALVRLAGRTVDQAVVQAPVGLCVGLGAHGRGGDKGPKSRMGVAMKLRELFSAEDPPPDDPPAKKKKKRGGGGEEDEDTPATAAWKAVRARTLKVFFEAERADDLLTAVRLRDEFGLDAVIMGGAEAWVVADQLAAAGIPLVIGPTTVQPSSFEHPHARYDNAALLHAAGVPFALRTDNAHNSRELPVQAGIAVAHGLPWAAAVHAITGALGDILGLPGLGRLDVGQPASLLLCSGDPLQARTAVQRMWIDGRPASLESRQTRLFERFRVLQ